MVVFEIFIGSHKIQESRRAYEQGLTDTTDLGNTNPATAVFSLARKGLLQGMDYCQIAKEPVLSSGEYRIKKNHNKWNNIP